MFESRQILNLKLREVLDLLDENQVELESVERAIKDQELKQVILQLMCKNREYAQQLLANLLPDGSSCRTLKRYTGVHSPAGGNHLISKEELLEKCKKEESAFEKTYREVLNTSNLQDGLRQMMQLQLNELKTLFLKIRINYMVKCKMLSPYTLRKNYS